MRFCRLFTALVISLSFSWPALSETLVIGGNRPADLYSPEGSLAGVPKPLILFLHGYDNSGPRMNKWLKIDKETNRLGYLALVPRGTPDQEGKNFWNATPECCNHYNNPRDDVAYLLSLIEEARTHVTIGNVYIIGFSNGGFMANRMACENPDLIKGVISLAGGSFKDMSLCKNPGSISYLQIHGTLDPAIPYFSNPDYPGAVETVLNWSSVLDCRTSRVELESVNLMPWEWGNETDALIFEGCKDQARLGLWTIQDGLHENVFRNLIEQAMNFLIL